MNGHRKPPPTRTTTAVSCMNRFLSSITLVALGAIGGFAIFHSAFQYRIEQTQYNNNETLEIVKSRCFESEKERQRCVETDDGRLREISDLRGRLDAQYKSWRDLSATQRSVLSRERESREQVQRFHEVYERDQQTLASLKDELDQKDRELVVIQEKFTKVEGDLRIQRRTESDLSSTLTRFEESRKQETDGLRVQLKQKENQIKDMEQSLGALSQQKEKVEDESQELRRKIQQRDDDLENATKNFYVLQNQKERLDQYLAEIEGRTGRLESQIVEKDKELFKYREEEGDLEAQLVNFREGMLELLREKIGEIRDLEKHVASLNQEKTDLEEKLENWREGMLKLVKEKIEEIDELKEELEESQESTEMILKEIEHARSEQIDAEEFVRLRLDMIDENDVSEEEEVMRKLMEEIERVRAQLKKSQEWVTEVTKDMEYRKADQIESEELITEKTNEINSLKLQIERDQEFAKQKISHLESDLVEAQKLVVEKANEIERLNLELGEFITEINNLKSIIVPGITTSEMMIKHIQQRDGMICRQLFGKGPYYVKFVVKLPPPKAEIEYNETLFFVIELSSRKELPHSTYTFLTLVESNLYNDGVAVLSAGDIGGLRIASSQSPDTISLERKLKPLGLTDGSSLSFVESPTSDNPLLCGEHSLGFVQRGPGLDLFLPGKDGGTFDDNKTGCFAQVIRGQENLQKIQSLLIENREPMEIVLAKHLRVD